MGIDRKFGFSLLECLIGISFLTGLAYVSTSMIDQNILGAGRVSAKSEENSSSQLISLVLSSQDNPCLENVALKDPNDQFSKPMGEVMDQFFIGGRFDDTRTEELKTLLKRLEVTIRTDQRVLAETGLDQEYTKVKKASVISADKLGSANPANGSPSFAMVFGIEYQNKDERLGVYTSIKKVPLIYQPVPGNLMSASGGTCKHENYGATNIDYVCKSCEAMGGTCDGTGGCTGFQETMCTSMAGFQWIDGTCVSETDDLDCSGVVVFSDGTYDCKDPKDFDPEPEAIAALSQNQKPTGPGHPITCRYTSTNGNPATQTCSDLANGTGRCVFIESVDPLAPKGWLIWNYGDKNGNVAHNPPRLCDISLDFQNDDPNGRTLASNERID
jgi:hypothetical protein